MAAYQIVSGYLTDTMITRLAQALEEKLLLLPSASMTLAECNENSEMGKRKADWMQALEIEKECGSKYSAVVSMSASTPSSDSTKKSNTGAKKVILVFRRTALYL